MKKNRDDCRKDGPNSELSQTDGMNDEGSQDQSAQQMDKLTRPEKERISYQLASVAHWLNPNLSEETLVTYYLEDKIHIKGSQAGMM